MKITGSLSKSVLEPITGCVIWLGDLGEGCQKTGQDSAWGPQYILSLGRAKLSEAIAVIGSRSSHSFSHRGWCWVPCRLRSDLVREDAL